MVFSSINSAPPFSLTPTEFASRVLSEVEKGLKHGTIKPEQLEIAQPLNPPGFLETKTIIHWKSGKETFKKMSEALQLYSLSLKFCCVRKTFTILGNTHLHPETLRKMLAETACNGWKPKILDKVDESGNRLGILEPILNDIERRQREEALRALALVMLDCAMRIIKAVNLLR